MSTQRHLDKLMTAAMHLEQSTADDITRRHQQIADELAADDELMAMSAQMADVQLSLSDYLEAVKLVVHDTFDHDVWLRAEVRAVSGKGGHYYFELAEKDDTGQIVAAAKATLWRYRASSVMAKFTASTGTPISAGMSILVKANATFHPQYGFSINISDIDPNYTLGALAMAYHAMLKRLQNEGLTTLNKSLPTPFDIRDVIVIAPENAAGLGDFRAEADRLASTNACRFYYHHATFQGNHAPSEIRTSITHTMREFVQKYERSPDLLVIIRGGGAVGDLAYLNDYELAALVAEQPVPVWVGVGHERDRILLDEVAHTRFDTPSKVIAAIESHLLRLVQSAKTIMQSTQTMALQRLHNAQTKSQAAMTRSKLIAQSRLLLADKDSRHAMTHSQMLVRQRMSTNKTRLDAQLKRVQTAAKAQISTAKAHTATHLATHQRLRPRLINLNEHCRQLSRLILVQHPKRTLEQGYALVRDGDGALISTAKHAQAASVLQVEFKDGVVQAVPK
ncbi:exodeoxyribonuclease VII large subunit [Moraxella caviae]|nr:exodeoxyribonuclease VII large subunit [Moraxella caviae]OOR92118.1 exodeoxyribonuclease VII large subunit [Moraxella caviae]